MLASIIFLSLSVAFAQDKSGTIPLSPEILAQRTQYLDLKHRQEIEESKFLATIVRSVLDTLSDRVFRGLVEPRCRATATNGFGEDDMGEIECKITKLNLDFNKGSISASLNLRKPGGEWIKHDVVYENLVMHLTAQALRDENFNEFSWIPIELEGDDGSSLVGSTRHEKYPKGSVLLTFFWPQNFKKEAAALGK